MTLTVTEVRGLELRVAVELFSRQCAVPMTPQLGEELGHGTIEVREKFWRTIGGDCAHFAKIVVGGMIDEFEAWGE